MTSADHATPSDRAVQAFAATTTALVQPHDVIGTTVRLMQAAVDTAGATAAGLIMRRPGQDRLQMLAATSHRAEELEVYQAQQEQGPCFDAVDTGEIVRAGHHACCFPTRSWPPSSICDCPYPKTLWRCCSPPAANYEAATRHCSRGVR